MTTNVYDPEERAALVAHYGEIEVLKAEQRELRLRNLDAAVWVRCPGEAHKTPFIDHCMVCMPWWGSWPACPICGKRLTDKFYCRTCRAHFGDRKPEYRTFELKAPEK